MSMPAEEPLGFSAMRMSQLRTSAPAPLKPYFSGFWATMMPRMLNDPFSRVRGPV